MKLGIFLLVFGLLIAAVGVSAWQYVEPAMLEAIIGEYSDADLLVLIRAGGIGLTVFGGGLALGGIVRMIVKR